MSSTADARRDAPARAPGEPAHARVRAPRPWAASLQRPAAKILLAGGLTLAGWLLGAALSGDTASAAERPACPEAPVVSTVDHAVKPFSHARHRKSDHDSGERTCAAQPKTDSAEPPPADETPVTPETTKDSSAAEEPAATTPDSASAAGTTATPESVTAEAPVAASSESLSADEPAATRKTTTKATSSSGGLLGNLVGGTLETVSAATTADVTGEPAAASSGGTLLGGLVGSVLDVVGGTLTTVTGTVGAVTDTLSHTVLAPLTQPPAGHPDAPVLLPLDDILAPVFGGSSNSGGVTVTVPGVTTVVVQAPAAVLETVPAAAVPTATASQQPAGRVVVVHLAERHAESLPAVHEQPRDSRTRATGGGGDSTPGLPGGTTAPSAPALTAAQGHDGSGGARHAFAVHTDDVTTTQLKLIGTSRDHEVDGAGREAALPTTSPD